MALAIEYERADQRRHHRVTAPLFVALNGKQLRAVDWSVGGLRVEDVPGSLPDVGDLIEAEITLPYQDFKITFDAELEIVRHVEGGGGFGAKFTSLGEREEELMTHFVEEIIRGSMVDVKETIARMDVPLTPVSTQPAKKPVEETPVHRWARKEIIVPALYGLLGVLVFGYTAFVAYTNIFHLVVETAVVGGPVGVVKARSDGEVIYKGFEIGDRVKRGDIIAQVNDAAMDARIDKARIDVRRKQSEQRLAQRQYDLALARIQQYVLVNSGSTAGKKRELANLRRQYRHLSRRHARLKKELRSRRTRRKTVDTALAALLRVRTKRDKVNAELSVMAKFAKGNGRDVDLAKLSAGGVLSPGMVFNGKSIIDDASNEKARLDFLSGEVGLAREEVAVLEKQKAQNTVKAPWDSRLVDLPKLSSSTILRGDVIAVFEPAKAYAVTAWLTQQEILKVKIGDTASVFVPALDKSVRARIKSIDRHFAFVSEKETSYVWRPKEQRNARVILEISAAEHAAAQHLTTGLPAVIMFRDREPNYLLSYILPGFLRASS